MTSAELPMSIRTRLISQVPCWTVMNKGSSSCGLISRASSLEKTMLAQAISAVILEKLEDMTFVASTCHAYLRQEVLERPLLEIPSKMVLSAWCRTMSVISYKERKKG